MKTTITIGLGIPHTPWVPERCESLSKLLEELEPRPEGRVTVQCFTERAPYHVWSGNMWLWGLAQTRSHFLTLQDDAIVSPSFWPRLFAMLEAVPDKVIGLEVVHPAAPALAEIGHRWMTTTDCLVGVGYAMPTNTLGAFLEWRATALLPGAVEAITEDTLVALWCMVTGRRIWHPIPTLIDHDTGLASTYGNDAHQNRRPLVKWDHPAVRRRYEEGEVPALESPHYWEPRADPPHVGRFYESTPSLALQWVRGYDARAYSRDMKDNGRGVVRLLARERARRLPEPKARVFVCTPTRGSVHPDYVATIAKLTSAPDLDVDIHRFELERLQQRNADVVRVRSAFVREFLEETDATHLLFVDSDVSFEPRLLRGMLATGHGFVAAPYPSRSAIDFARAVKAGDLAEAAAYRYAIHLLDDKLEVDALGSAEIKHIGLGCALLSRECLDVMVDHYAGPPHDLVFQERSRGRPIPTVALFQLILEGEELYSEDYSFCERWRRIGGKVHMYLGPGAPATHHGDHAFRGRIEAFGLKHEVD